MHQAALHIVWTLPCRPAKLRRHPAPPLQPSKSSCMVAYPHELWLNCHCPNNVAALKVAYEGFTGEHRKPLRDQFANLMVRTDELAAALPGCLLCCPALCCAPMPACLGVTPPRCSAATLLPPTAARCSPIHPTVPGLAIRHPQRWRSSRRHAARELCAVPGR